MKDQPPPKMPFLAPMSVEDLGYVKDKSILVIAAPTCGGKTALLREVLSRHEDSLVRLVSSTTRKPRQIIVPGLGIRLEEHGKDYMFYKPHEFETAVREGRFLECDGYTKGENSRYGTGLAELRSIWEDQGKIPVLAITLRGVGQVRERIPGAVTVFVQTPLEDIKRRLEDPAGEVRNDIPGRLEQAAWELDNGKNYCEFVVHNPDGQFAAAVDQLDVIFRRYILSCRRAATERIALIGAGDDD